LEDNVVEPSVWQKIMSWLDSLFQGALGKWSGEFDTWIIGLYTRYLAPIPLIIKVVGGILAVILLAFGTFGFIKKLWKLFLVLGIIYIGVVVLTAFL
jgi:hypothetical protein